jgi:hypothetical protein
MPPFPGTISGPSTARPPPGESCPLATVPPPSRPPPAPGPDRRDGPRGAKSPESPCTCTRAKRSVSSATGSPWPTRSPESAHYGWWGSRGRSGIPRRFTFLEAAASFQEGSWRSDNLRTYREQPVSPGKSAEAACCNHAVLSGNSPVDQVPLIVHNQFCSCRIGCPSQGDLASGDVDAQPSRKGQPILLHTNSRTSP